VDNRLHRPVSCFRVARPPSPSTAKVAAGATSSTCCRWASPSTATLASDGVDGQEEIAGALLAPDTLARAWTLGIKPRDSLANNDGHGFFEALGDSVITGPTLTNVNDFRAIFIEAPSKE
jgi:glycerate-2-kinase